MLPQMAPSGNPQASSNFDLDENTEYLTPQFRYFSEVMHHLSWSAHDFLEEGADLGPFLEAFEEVKQNFHRFVDVDLPQLQESFAWQKSEVPDDQIPRQLAYLNTKGVNYYEEGIAKVEQFLGSLQDEEGANPDLLIDGITRILDGNDHFCLCIEVTHARIKVLEEYIRTGRVPDHVPTDEEAEAAASEAPATEGAEPEPVGAAEDDGLV